MFTAARFFSHRDRPRLSVIEKGRYGTPLVIVSFIPLTSLTRRSAFAKPPNGGLPVTTYTYSRCVESLLTQRGAGRRLGLE